MNSDADPPCSSGKTGYPTADAAAKALHAAAKRTRKIKLHRYRCEECGQWHLTRMDAVKLKRRQQIPPPSHV